MIQYYADRHAQHILQVVTPVAILILVFMIWFFLSILPRWLLWVLTVLLGVAAVFFALIFLPLWFGSVSYTVTATHITKRSGIVFVQEQVMRTQALQYSTVLRTSWSEKTGMNFISLHAYGGTIYLSFLRRSDAEEIQAFLQHTVYHQAQYDVPEEKISKELAEEE